MSTPHHFICIFETNFKGQFEYKSYNESEIRLKWWGVNIPRTLKIRQLEVSSRALISKSFLPHSLLFLFRQNLRKYRRDWSKADNLEDSDLLPFPEEIPHRFW